MSSIAWSARLSGVGPPFESVIGFAAGNGGGTSVNGEMSERRSGSAGSGTLRRRKGNKALAIKGNIELSASVLLIAGGMFPAIQSIVDL